jgi:hypothetical protein
MWHRLVEFAESLEHAGQIVMCLWVIGLRLQGLAETGDGCLKPPLLGQYDAKTIVNTSQMRCRPNDELVEMFGLAQVPGCMMLRGQAQGFVYGWHDTG